MKREKDHNIRIVFFTNYSGLYGANRSLLDIITGLDRFNIKSMVVTPESGFLTDYLEYKRVPYLSILFFPSMIKGHKARKGIINLLLGYYQFIKTSFAYRSFNNLQSNEIAAAIREFHPDLIYTNTSVIDIGIQVARRLKIPHIWHLREFGYLDYQRKPILKRKAIQALFRDSQKIIGISESISNFYSKKYRIDVETIYNGVYSLDELPSLEHGHSRRDQGVIFGILGLLAQGKQQKEAIKAFELVNKEFPETKLLIGGDGPEKEYLEDMVKLRGIHNITFLGFVKDPKSFFAQIDCTLMCSRHEGLGRVTLESMAHSIPVIGYDGGATRELIKDQETGLLYKGGYKELVSQMNLLANNRKLITSLGNNAKKRFEKYFTRELMIKNIYSAIQECI